MEAFLTCTKILLENTSKDKKGSYMQKQTKESSSFVLIGVAVFHLAANYTQTRVYHQ